MQAGLVLLQVVLLSGCALWGKAQPPRPRPIAGLAPPAPAPSSPAPTVAGPPPRPPLSLPVAETSPAAEASPSAETAPTAEAPPEAEAPRPAAPRLAAPTKPVALHFEDADLEQVLKALSGLAGINFVLAQGVKVKVTMHIDGLPATEAFSILESILEANNLIAIKSGLIYKIVPLAAASQQPSPLGMGKELAAEEGFLTQIVTLKHLSADELVRSLQPIVAPQKILAYRETNSVVLSGPASMLKRLLQVIQSLDVPGQQRDVAQIFVYHVENAKATELAGVLNSLFGNQGPVVRPAVKLPPREAVPPPEMAPPVAPPPPPRPGVTPEPSERPRALPPGTPPPAEQARSVGDIRIVPDERTNALLVRATPNDYRVLEDTIKKLDIIPKQVLIEVLLAEVTLTDRLRLGIEQFLKLGDVALQQFFGLGPVPQALVAGAATNTPGFTLTFVDGDKFRLFLNSLSSYTKVNTVASPHILTQDNREARIQVGQEVPVVTGEVGSLPVLGQQQGGGSTVFRTIQQRDVGRILLIKPHVNEKRQVTLDVQVEATDVLPNSTVAGTPSFNKRTAQTSVVVSDGQALLIGGIISDIRQNEVSGVPLLSRIPLLGWLFGTRAKSEDRTELLILLTPHVIASPEQGRVLTEQFKKRLEWLEEANDRRKPF